MPSNPRPSSILLLTFIMVGNYTTIFHKVAFPKYVHWSFLTSRKELVFMLLRLHWVLLISTNIILYTGTPSLIPIIQRNLKPENLLLDREGHIRITDFSLSKDGVVNDSVNSICGTPEYLSPEILQKKVCMINQCQCSLTVRV